MPKILIADDDPDIRMLLTSRLQANHYEVIQASDCNQAIKKAYAEQPDVILMDIRMPSVGGIRAFDSLKMYARTENIPVIFITAYPGKEVEEKSMEMGAAAFLAKPFETEELLKTIQKVLQK
jgi:CheY-like chemotaxis protein